MRVLAVSGQAAFSGEAYLRGTKEERARRIVVGRQENEHGIAYGPWVAFLERDRAPSATLFDGDDGEPGGDGDEPY